MYRHPKQNIAQWFFIAELVFGNQAERISLGEECDFYFVADVLHQAIELWNGSIDKLEERMSTSAGILQELDKVSAGTDVVNPEKAADQLEEKFKHKMANLIKIALKPTENNFLTLTCRVWLAPFSLFRF